MNQGQKEGIDLSLYRQTYNKSNIIYKNVLLDEKDEQERPCSNKPQNCLIENADKTDDIWQMYQQYASNALENLPPSNNCCKNQDEANKCTNDYIEKNMSNPANCCASKPIQINDVNAVLEQLDRMEQMLKEIYLCNQELCKSLVNYCCKYVND